MPKKENIGANVTSSRGEIENFRESSEGGLTGLVA